MLKPATLKIEDSNIANLGSDLEREVKKASAETEPAWANAGKEEGIQIWRIEKFKVISWPKEEYGSFYSGDSYIILNTYKVENKILYNVHFWLGAHTTQDEAGTAAYKTVELDTLLDDLPVQYREVMGNESDEFKALFPGGIKIMAGGVDSGFRHVEPEKYRARLLHIKGTRKTVTAMEVPMRGDSFNAGDVFILDMGMKVYQWNGSSAGIWEKQKAAELVRAIDDERKSAVDITTCEQGADGDFRWDVIEGGKPDPIPAATPDDQPQHTLKLFKASDESGNLEVTEIASGKDVTEDKLDTNDVFILDAGHTIYVWIGKGASAQERKMGLQIAADYVKKAGKPANQSIARVMEGGENETFHGSFQKA